MNSFPIDTLSDVSDSPSENDSEIQMNVRKSTQISSSQNPLSTGENLSPDKSSFNTPNQLKRPRKRNRKK